MANFIVIGKGFNFHEAIRMTAETKQLALFAAAKKMKCGEPVLIDEEGYLKNVFESNCFNAVVKPAIIQDGTTVVIKMLCVPKYEKGIPYDEDVCRIAAEILSNENITHIICGENLPTLRIRGSCYYCGDDTCNCRF